MFTLRYLKYNNQQQLTNKALSMMDIHMQSSLGDWLCPHDLLIEITNIIDRCKSQLSAISLIMWNPDYQTHSLHLQQISCALSSTVFKGSGKTHKTTEMKDFFLQISTRYWQPQLFTHEGTTQSGVPKAVRQLMLQLAMFWARLNLINI